MALIIVTLVVDSPNNFDGASVSVGAAFGSFIVGTYVKTKAHVDKRFWSQSAGFASGGGAVAQFLVQLKYSF